MVIYAGFGTSRLDSKQMNQMANTTVKMVNICKQLEAAKVEQGAQISKLNTKLDALTKMVEKLRKLNKMTSTTEKTQGKCKTCNKHHKKGLCWEEEKNAALRPPNWKLVKN